MFGVETHCIVSILLGTFSANTHPRLLPRDDALFFPLRIPQMPLVALVLTSQKTVLESWECGSLVSVVVVFISLIDGPLAMLILVDDINRIVLFNLGQCWYFDQQLLAPTDVIPHGNTVQFQSICGRIGQVTHSHTIAFYKAPAWTLITVVTHTTTTIKRLCTLTNLALITRATQIFLWLIASLPSPTNTSVSDLVEVMT
jgi:hypothetical protein